MTDDRRQGAVANAAPGAASIPSSALCLLSFALGAFCVLGFAPFNAHFTVWPAPTIALGGLFLLWHRAPTMRAAALLGLAWGAGCFLFGVSWVYVSLSQFGGMAPPAAAAATLLFCVYLALFPALAGALFLRWRSNTARCASSSTVCCLFMQ